MDHIPAIRQIRDEVSARKRRWKRCIEHNGLVNFVKKSLGYRLPPATLQKRENNSSHFAYTHLVSLMTSRIRCFCPGIGGLRDGMGRRRNFELNSSSLFSAVWSGLIAILLLSLRSIKRNWRRRRNYNWMLFAIVAAAQNTWFKELFSSVILLLNEYRWSSVILEIEMRSLCSEKRKKMCNLIREWNDLD